MTRIIFLCGLLHTCLGCMRKSSESNDTPVFTPQAQAVPLVAPPVVAPPPSIPNYPPLARKVQLAAAWDLLRPVANSRSSRKLKKLLAKGLKEVKVIRDAKFEDKFFDTLPERPTDIGSGRLPVLALTGNGLEASTTTLEDCYSAQCDFEFAEGQRYVAAYLESGEVAGIETSVDFFKMRFIKFAYYKATQGVEIFACCDNTLNCQLHIPGDIRSNSRRWKTAGFFCGLSTSKVIFICRNRERNEGACGFDNIELFDAVDTSQKLC